jgi:uncharacterized membrane protein
MLNKVRLLFAVFFLFIIYFVNITSAQEVILSEEVTSFTADIFVNPDNSIDVKETIIYNSAGSERHGIYRDIDLRSSQNRKMSISRVSVMDEKGEPYNFEFSDGGGGVRIKIGDADKTFTGEKTYVIKYNATKATAQYEEFDELYWNVTGNEWNMPIKNTKAFVHLPEGALVEQSSCYFGIIDSTNLCDSKSEENGVYAFGPISYLGFSEGVTVAVGFQKGILTPYSSAEDFFEKYGAWFWSLVLPILIFIFSFLRWQRLYKDPKGRGVIVPQYDVPEDLTPMEVKGIMEEKVDGGAISSEIIYLATKGYLKINQIEKHTLGIFKSTDYEFVKLQDFSLLSNNALKKLLEALFDNNASSVKLSDLKNNFYTEIPDITTLVLNGFLKKGYYKNLGKMKYGGGGIIIFLFLAIFASGFLGGIVGGVFLNNPFPMMVSVFASIVIYGVFYHLSPAKTKKGVEMKEHLLGLKDYLQIAEKDRLEFHNAPEKKPEIFEKLLPFAMVMGVADIWAKEFEDIYTKEPSWYSGSSAGVFHASMFSHTLSDFSSSANSSLSSSPSRSGGSGSGGGGFSGGGGGGGGGGSW